MCLIINGATQPRNMKYFNMFEVRSPHRDKTFLCLVIFQFVVCPHVPKSWSSTMQNATIIWSASQLIVVIMKKWNMKIQLKENLKEWYTLKHKNEAITMKMHELNFIISTKTNYKDYFNKKNNYTSASVLLKLRIAKFHGNGLKNQNFKKIFLDHL